MKSRDSIIQRTYNINKQKMIFKRNKFWILLIYLVIILLSNPTQGASAIKYETAYACDGKMLTLGCQPGDLINLIRANYGRFSLTICNDNGNVDWSVNCMSSAQTLRVLTSKCGDKQTCNVKASTHQFGGDPCPGTYKYLEAHYQCVSAAQTLKTTTVKTTTTRPSPPPWLLAQQPPNVTPAVKQTPRLPSGDGTEKIHLGAQKPSQTSSPITPSKPNIMYGISGINPVNQTSDINMGYGGGFIGTGYSTNKGGENYFENKNTQQFTTEKSTTFHIHSTSGRTTFTANTNSVIKNQNIFSTDSTIQVGHQDENSGIVASNDFGFCGATTARNLFWNITKMGESNVQSCPDGTTGIAKWRCISKQFKISQDNLPDQHQIQLTTDLQQPLQIQDQIQLVPIWQTQSPDLSQCRSLWVTNLETRVKDRESSLMSIANDLSQITGSKSLYGGDLVLVTNIIQTMSDRMSYDIETFPEQRQREAILNELLTSIVKISSNLLNDAEPWLDLSFADQKRKAVALLTGLENNAFLLADCIIRDKIQIQKSKNILLSVHVIETKSITSAEEVFPNQKNNEIWEISEDQIILPRAALLENADGGVVRIVFIVFDRLETILKPTDLDSKPTTNQETEEPIKILNSKIISASLGKLKHTKLSKPIKLVFKHLLTVNVSNPSCVYWNFIEHAWITEGCHLETTNRTHSICVCNHLTNFAILMDIVDNTHQHESLFAVFPAINLRIFIYISMALCIIFIAIALLFTVKTFENGSTRTSIYKNIYICLSIVEILFFVGTKQTETNLLCGFTSAFLHWFILSSIAWTCCESLRLLLLLKSSDEIEASNSKPIWYYLFTYGLSFAIVAISLAIDPSTYTKSDFCVLMTVNLLFYLSFLLPIFIFLCGACICAILIFILICRKYPAAKNKEHTKLSSIRFDLQCSFIFLLFLCADWVFCSLYLRKAKENDDSALTYGYLFATFNFILGIYIFIFHCAQDERIRREYRKYLRQNLWLPNCLRESNSLQSNAGAAQPPSHFPPHQQHYGTSTQQKKNSIMIASNSADLISEMQIGTAAGIISSAGTPTSRKFSNFVDEKGIIDGTLQRVPPRHMILECGQISGIQSGGTLRRQSAGDISPSSSIDSSNLMLAQQQENWNYPTQQQQKLVPDHQIEFYPNENKNLNTSFDNKFLYYDCKSNRISFSNDFHQQQSPGHRHKNGDVLRSNEFGSSSCSSGSNYNNHGHGRDEPIYEEIPNSHLSSEYEDEYTRRFHHLQQQQQQQQRPHQNFITEEYHPHLHHYHQQMRNPSGSLASRKSNKNTNRKANKKRLNEEQNDFSGKIIQQPSQQQIMHQQQPNQQLPTSQVVGRNLSAMLDENNTVVSYLEP